LDGDPAIMNAGKFTVAVLSLMMHTATQAHAETPVAAATFACKGGKTIEASFYADKVALKLSDGRSMSLPQAMAASGARYADTDESFVFWNKGDTAFVTEGKDNAETYSGCVAKQ
jgi:membrane-bound inhibitor of C-type lysozyme